ncbi:hypothetical protein PBY51_014298 [Eleginops maclovinus]|uniref:Uncharacterized protein n=1 Tax=Eleginops maclovinus TaxID=56733 RepID=A0AAN7WWK1_ELEMC|nr:hypothetical protein PBY51_014298 [Eleginops maclovinus]
MCVIRAVSPDAPLLLPTQEGEQVGAPSFCARWLHIDKSIRLHLITGGTGATNRPVLHPHHPGVPRSTTPPSLLALITP